MSHRLLLLLVALATLCQMSQGQEQVRHGVLPCGLTYHITSDPQWGKSKSEARLVLPIGSLEERGRSGVAHFIEHMAFRGTKHFPDRSIQQFVERHGGAFGYDLNALTGYDRTIYLLSFPPEQTDTALLILSDWLGNISIEPETIDQERPIILEEMRHFVPNDPYDHLFIGTGVHAGRIPLGSEEDVRSIRQDDLLDYYRRWYRPEYAHVVLVGACPAEVVEQKLRALFDKYPAATSEEAPTRPRLEYPDHPICRTETDTLYHSHKLRYITPFATTSKDSPQRFAESLVTKLLNHLLDQVGGGTLSTWHYLAGTGLMELEVTDADEAKLTERLHTSLRLLEQVRRNGLGQDRDYLTTFVHQETASEPVSSSHSSVLPTPAQVADLVVDELIEGDYRPADDSLPTANRLDCIARQLLEARSRPIVLYRRGRRGTQTAEDFLTYEHALPITLPRLVQAEKLPTNDTVVESGLSQALPRPWLEEIRPINTTGCDSLGVTIAHYPGEHRLIIKSLKDPDAQTRIISSSPGGSDCLPSPTYAEVAAVIDDSDDWQTLYSHGLSVGSTIAPDRHGFYAFAEKADTLPMLLAYLYQKIDRPDPDTAFTPDTTGQDHESLLSALISRDPGHRVTVLTDAVLGHVSSTESTSVPSTELLRPSQVYRLLYSNLGGGYTVICSPLSPDSVIRAFGQTLAHFSASTLPTEPHRLPSASADYIAPSDTISATHYLCWGTFEPSLRNGLKLKIVREALRSHQLDLLRTAERLVYSPTLSLEYTALSPHEGRYILDLQNNILTDHLERLRTLVEPLVNDFDLTPERLVEIKRGLSANRAMALSDPTPADWMDILTDLLDKGESIPDFERYDEILRSITLQEVIDYWRKHLAPARQHQWIIY